MLWEALKVAVELDQSGCVRSQGRLRKLVDKLADEMVLAGEEFMIYRYLTFFVLLCILLESDPASQHGF